MSTPELVEGEDFYTEGGFLVFTARYHLRRGYCCESGCRHCPYGRRAEAAPRGGETETRDADARARANGRMSDET